MHQDVAFNGCTFHIHCAPPRKPPRLRLKIDFGNFSVEGKDMAITIKAGQRGVATISHPVDKFGNPAAIDGAPVWSTSDDTKFALTPSDDGMSCVIQHLGPVGDAQVKVAADADLGEGSKEIASVIDLTAVAGDAVGFDLNVGAFEDPPLA